jgi:hypothetical protein
MEGQRGGTGAFPTIFPLPHSPMAFAPSSYTIVTTWLFASVLADLVAILVVPIRRHRRHARNGRPRDPRRFPSSSFVRRLVQLEPKREPTLKDDSD